MQNKYLMINRPRIRISVLWSLNRESCHVPWPGLWTSSSSHHLCPCCKPSNTYIWGVFTCTSFQAEGPHEFFSFSFMWDHRALQRVKLCYWQRSLRPEGFSPPASVTKRFQDKALFFLKTYLFILGREDGEGRGKGRKKLKQTLSWAWSRRQNDSMSLRFRPEPKPRVRGLTACATRSPRIKHSLLITKVSLKLPKSENNRNLSAPPQTHLTVSLLCP